MSTEITDAKGVIVGRRYNGGTRGAIVRIEASESLFEAARAMPVTETGSDAPIALGDWHDKLVDQGYQPEYGLPA